MYHPIYYGHIQDYCILNTICHLMIEEGKLQESMYLVIFMMIAIKVKHKKCNGNIKQEENFVR